MHGYFFSSFLGKLFLWQFLLGFYFLFHVVNFRFLNCSHVISPSELLEVRQVDTFCVAGFSGSGAGSGCAGFSACLAKNSCSTASSLAVVSRSFFLLIGSPFVVLILVFLIFL